MPGPLNRVLTVRPRRAASVPGTADQLARNKVAGCSAPRVVGTRRTAGTHYCRLALNPCQGGYSARPDLHRQPSAYRADALLIELLANVLAWPCEADLGRLLTHFASQGLHASSTTERRPGFTPNKQRLGSLSPGLPPLVYRLSPLAAIPQAASPANAPTAPAVRSTASNGYAVLPALECPRPQGREYAVVK